MQLHKQIKKAEMTVNKLKKSALADKKIKILIFK